MLPESEWEAFMTSLRTPLPTTFRFTGSKACVLNGSRRRPMRPR